MALSSGTAAMHLALKLLGVGSGDEVFASTLTFMGSVSPITYLGATTVFIDCDRESWNMDPDLLEKALDVCKRRGKMPKAVVPTDLYGQCCDLPKIASICNQYDIPVVCDSAEAMGAKYQMSVVSGQWSGKDRVQSSEVTGQKWGLREMPTSDLRPPASGAMREKVQELRCFHLTETR